MGHINPSVMLLVIRLQVTILYRLKCCITNQMSNVMLQAIVSNNNFFFLNYQKNKKEYNNIILLKYYIIFCKNQQPRSLCIDQSYLKEHYFSTASNITMPAMVAWRKSSNVDSHFSLNQWINHVQLCSLTIIYI